MKRSMIVMTSIAATGLGLSLMSAPALAQCSASKEACSSDSAMTAVNLNVVDSKKSIVETAIEAGSFKTLVTAVKAAGLVDALNGDGPFTVFAPTDEAFGKLPKSTLESLLKPENRDKLKSILTYHVVEGRYPASKVVDMTSATTLNGQQLDIKLDGEKVMVDGTNVISTDIICKNGVIHVIDSVMLPVEENIVETAVSAGQFNTLVAAVKAAGLVDTLSGKGPFTVFAPTDEAFAKLPRGTLEMLLEPENRDKLVSILTYHVVPGRILARDAVAAANASTVEGEKVRIRIDDHGQLRVNGARIISTNVETSNGVIHVIDEVILPPSW